MCRVRVICHPQCELAESPVWDERVSMLYFVDIEKSMMYQSSLTGSLKSWRLSDKTGAIVLTNRKDKLVAAQRNRFVSIDISPFHESTLIKLADEPLGNRFNDGKCDPSGRFWAATMDEGCLNPTGSIWSIDSSLHMQQHSSGYIVGNGFGWNSKGDRFYFTDSENRTIFYWSFDSKYGRLVGERRVFSTVGRHDGLPDGLCVDAEDYVWSAHWDGGKLTRYSPDGMVDRTVHLPVPRPTSIAFGGENFTTLFVTTARNGLNQSDLERFPLSGAILSIQCDVAGVSSSRFYTDNE